MEAMICGRAESSASAHLSKLQAHKSSFQAWRSVSLVFALIVLILIGSKRHEVGSDSHQLDAVARLVLSANESSSLDQNERATAEPELLGGRLGGGGAYDDDERAVDGRTTMSLGSLLDALESALPSNASEPLDAAQMIPVPSSSSLLIGANKSALASAPAQPARHASAATGAKELLRAEVRAFAGELERFWGFEHLLRRRRRQSSKTVPHRLANPKTKPKTQKTSSRLQSQLSI